MEASLAESQYKAREREIERGTKERLRSALLCRSD
jgi:hypothetical protein